MMDAPTERVVDKVIKYGTVFAEVSSSICVFPYGNRHDIDTFQLNPVAKAVFGLARVTFEVRACHWHIRPSDDA
jgi:hypothetical protein